MDNPPSYYASINYETGDVFIWDRNATPENRADDRLVGVGNYGESAEERQAAWSGLVNESVADPASFFQEIGFQSIEPISLTDAVSQINEHGSIQAQDARSNATGPQTESPAANAMPNDSVQNADRTNLTGPAYAVFMPEANIVANTGNKYFATKTALDAAREADKMKDKDLAQEYRDEAKKNYYDVKGQDDRAMFAAFTAAMAAPAVGVALLNPYVDAGLIAFGIMVGGKSDEDFDISPVVAAGAARGAGSLFGRFFGRNVFQYGREGETIAMANQSRLVGNVANAPVTIRITNADVTINPPYNGKYGIVIRPDTGGRLAIRATIAKEGNTIILGKFDIVGGEPNQFGPMIFRQLARELARYEGVTTVRIIGGPRMTGANPDATSHDVTFKFKRQ